ncbi:MAG: phage major capsid protein [Mycobacterium sp.]
MPAPLQKKKITPEDLGAELVRELGVKAASVEAWKKKALAHVRSKMLEVVDAEGNAIDATLVVGAVAPDEKELEPEDEGDGTETKNEDAEEDEDGLETQKALVQGMLKTFERDNRRETDARIKTLRVTGGGFRNDDDKRHGFKSMGEFAKTVKGFVTHGERDERLLKGMGQKDADGVMTKAPSTFASTGVGADGGFLVPTEFRASINEHLFGDQALLPLTDMLTVSGNTIVVPRDETTPWGGDGVSVSWPGEKSNRAITASKPKLGEDTIKLNKVAALVPVTEELADDSAIALESYLDSKVGAKLDYAVADAFINGDGNGKPLGVLNSGALVTVAKETSQTADTINTANVLKMVEALHASNDSSVRWIHHRTAFSQLAQLTLGDAPMFIPAGTIDQKVRDASLLGYGMRKHQAAQIVGDKGDVYLIDWSAYQTAVKTVGVKRDVSMHLYFDTDDLAFRYVFRVAGQSKFTQAITDANGGGTSSPFVTLAARA